MDGPKESISIQSMQRCDVTYLHYCIFNTFSFPPLSVKTSYVRAPQVCRRHGSFSYRHHPKLAESLAAFGLSSPDTI